MIVSFQLLCVAATNYEGEYVAENDSPHGVVFLSVYCAIWARSIDNESGFERNGEWLVFNL